MKNKIMIGADELILWLRKNKKAKGVSNRVLGKRIKEVICGDLEGIEVNKSKKSYWGGGKRYKFLSEYKLPKSSSQYSIKTINLVNLYRSINNW
jgi:hypothetical protein